VRSIAGGAVGLDDGTTLAADLVVLASGAWTPALAQLVGLDLPGEPVKGQMLRLAAPDGLLHAFIHSPDLYLIARAGQGVVVGATMERAGFDLADDGAAVERLAAGARRLLPALAHAPVPETWTGLRPRLLHGRPVLARLDDTLVLATGHFRNGILLAPATADAVLDLATGRTGGPWAPFALPGHHGLAGSCAAAERGVTCRGTHHG
jgi:glycine oxidase